MEDFGSLETDNARSVSVGIREEQAQDTRRTFGGTSSDIRLKSPSISPTNESPPLESQEGHPYHYQCSSLQRQGSGSGSDSAVEEDSYHTQDTHESFVPSGSRARNDKSIQRGHHNPDKTHIEDPTTVPRVRQMEAVASNLQDDPHSRREVLQEGCNVQGTQESIAVTGSTTESPKVRIHLHEDYSNRLMTFEKGNIAWPHRKPSKETMAAAGMIYIGVSSSRDHSVTYYDLVQCYKCNKTMYGFNEDDDPVIEHRKLNPNCI